MTFNWAHFLDIAQAVVDSAATARNEELLSSFAGLVNEVHSSAMLERILLDYRGDDAQLLISALYQLVRLLPSPQRNPPRAALLNLVEAAKLRPTALNVIGAQKQGLEFGSPNMDIHKGTNGGRAVALVQRRAIERDLEATEKMLNTEAVLLSVLDHPGVLSCEGIFNAGDSLGPYLVCCYCKEGTAVGYLSLHPDVDRFLLVKDIVSALVYLHTEGVVHGDLRGANILVDAAGRACVAGFGFSCLPSPTSQIRQSPGESISSDTVAWRAPGLLEAAIANASAGPTMASDIYSFGCLIYEMFTGKHPFWDVAKRSNAAFRARKIVRAVLENGSRPSKARAHEDAFRANGMTEEVWAAMEN